MPEPEDSAVGPAFVRLREALTPGQDWRRQANIARIMGDEPPPLRVGRFTVVEYVGRGAMGEVFAAHDDKLDRRIAIKLLAGQTSPAALDRFAREARSLAKLSHPNIVQIHEVGEHEGTMFIAMEYVTGRTLSQWLAPGTHSWRQIVSVFVEAGRGLAAAHAAGLVHRDFKPDNVIVGDDGRVRVLDFGLARPAESSAAAAEPTPADPTREPNEPPANATDSDRLTKTGSLVGTPAYMAPEQFREVDASAASDQFSFCVALYEGLYGVRPFAGRDLLSIVEAIGSGRIQPPQRSAPRWLGTTVRRGLSLQPEQRWPSMDALVSHLRRRSGPGNRWVAAALGGGLAVFGGGLWYQADLGQRCSGGRDQIAQTWNESSQQAVRDALLATGVAYAEPTAQRVQTRLDAFADAWARQHGETCEATQVRREQSAAVMDTQMRCLERQRTDLGAAIDVLKEADVSLLERAVPLTEGLPDPTSCGDTREESDDTLAPPADADVARQVEVQRERLARAKALQRAGKLADAETIADEIVTAAESLSYGPLLAEAKLTRGMARSGLSRTDEGREDLMDAFLLATEHEHPRVQATATVQLTWLVGRRSGQYEAALSWAQTALALARRPSGSPRAESLALDAMGSVYGGLNRMLDAADCQERALALIESVEEANPLLTAQMLNGLGATHRELNDLAEAHRLQTRALEINEATLGPDHPTVATSLRGLASTESEMRDLDGALAKLRRAEAILEGVGYVHPSLGGTFSAIGLALTRQGKSQEAIPYLDRAIEVEREILGHDHPDVARVFTALADAHKNIGDWPGALAAHEEARAVRLASLPPGDYVTATSTMSVGQMMIELGRLDEGRAMILEAIRDLESEGAKQTAGKPRLVLAMAHGSLSIVARSQGDVATAIDHGERAVDFADYPDTSRGLLTWAQEQLYEALWLDPTQRPRARHIVLQAIADNLHEGAVGPEPIEGFRLWLTDHPLPEPT